ncbi:metallophosphoesterase family protein [Dyella agri]|uniref:metallophosphoesterase family protein n=1 Tax=Dyella agri TaxID=1926869 RepID=UPI00384EE473
MNRIFFCGDPHGHFEHIIEAVHARRPVAIVLLGDVQAPEPLEVALRSIIDLTEVWWIHGNHDTDSDADYDNLFGSSLADRNLHGRVVEVAGVRIAGLGGIFRGQVWAPADQPRYPSPEAFLARCGKGNRWRGGLPRKHRSSIFPSDYGTLLQSKADVLVAHEAPSCHPHGFQAIDDLAVSLGVQMVYHGHHHRQADYRKDEAKRLGFRPFSVGYCAIHDEQGNIVRTTNVGEGL